MFADNDDNFLSGVAITGDLGVANSGYVALNDGSTVAGAIDASDGGSVELNGYTDITNAINLNDGNLYLTNAASLATPVTIDADVVIQGAGVVSDNSDGRGEVALQNEGTIDADVAGATLAVEPTGFVNDALAEATDGGALAIGNEDGGGEAGTQWSNAAGATISAAADSTLQLSQLFTNYGAITGAVGSLVELGGSTDQGDYGYWVIQGAISVTAGTLWLGSQSFSADTRDSWTNLGTITATESAVDLDGYITLADLGTFTRTGGSIALLGTLNLQGATLDLTSGLWQDLQLDGGTIENGAIVEDPADGLTVTGAGSVLDDVVVEGGLDIDGGTLTVQDGTTWTGAADVTNGNLTLNGYSDLTNNVTLVNGGLTADAPPSGTFAIEAGVTVSGAGEINMINANPGVIDNFGVIENDTPNSSLTISPGDFINDGDVEVSDGAQIYLEPDTNTSDSSEVTTNDADGTFSATNGADLYLDGRFTNEGLVTANDANVYLGGNDDDFDTQHWVNAGTINVTGGALTLGSPHYDSSSSTLSTGANTGTITTDGTAILINGPTTPADLGAIDRTGGSVSLAGALDLQSGSIGLSNGLFQNLQLNGGALLESGAIDDTSGGLNLTGGDSTLENLTVQGSLNISTTNGSDGVGFDLDNVTVNGALSFSTGNDVVAADRSERRHSGRRSQICRR